MPASDRRTDGELIAGSDALARETLLGVSGDQGPAMLRSWGRVVQAAAQLWLSLPADPSHALDPQVMAHLNAPGRGIARTVLLSG